MSKVVVVGQGYVGLPLAKAAVEAGHEVIGFDIDEAVVNSLASGTSSIDDVSDADVQKMLATDRYRPTDHPGKLAGFNVAVIAVPTPLRDGLPDLAAVAAAARTVADFLEPGALVVLESTVAPHTTTDFLMPLLDSRNHHGLSALADGYLLGFSPERIDPGNPTWNLVNTPKLVAGVTDAAKAATTHFYSSLCELVVMCPTVAVAELAKLLENTFRQVNIALINELGRHAHELGIDIWEVIAAASTKPYGFMPFRPGTGVGGHCLPVDPVFLARRVETSLGREFAFVDLAMQINRGQPKYVAERALRLLNDAGVTPKGASVLVLGAAYKAGTADIRETPVSDLIRTLVEWGVEVSVCDPKVADLTGFAERNGAAHAVPLDGLARTIGDYELVVLATDHDEFPFEAIARDARRVLDSRCRLKPAANIHRL